MKLSGEEEIFFFKKAGGRMGNSSMLDASVLHLKEENAAGDTSTKCPIRKR